MNHKSSSPLIMLIAGEVSGDIHGARLVSELSKKDKSIRFIGVGGDHMLQNGVHLYHDISELAVLGLVEVLINYPRIRSIFYDVLSIISKQKPDVVVLIDYPGFNIRLAKQIKKLGIPVIYYISPQVWAWATFRKDKIAKRVDKMLVFFEFEKDFYRDTGLDVEFVGHPLVDQFNITIAKDDFYKQNNISLTKKKIALLSGSRKNEILKILPVMIKSAFRINRLEKNVEFILPIGSSLSKEIRDLITHLLREYKVYDCENIKVINAQVHETMAYSDLALVASGTATLETACFETPMIIVYKVNFITAFLARMLIKIPYIGLVNVVAGEKIVPEFLQNDAKPDKIAETAVRYITDETYLAEKKLVLRSVHKKLGQPGAVSRAAQVIVDFLKRGKK